MHAKAVIELLHAQNNIAFIVLAPFGPFVCKLARRTVLASSSSANSNMMPFSATNKRSVFRFFKVSRFKSSKVHVAQPRGIGITTYETEFYLMINSAKTMQSDIRLQTKQSQTSPLLMW